MQEFYLGDITETLSSGGDASKYECRKIKEKGYDIPVYANSINDDGLYGYTNVSVISKDAVCISARGAGTGYVFFHKGPFVPIVRLISIVPNPSIADTRFLYYYLKTKGLWGDGSAIPQITVPMIRKEKIYLPSLIIQKKISAILSSLDAKIENNNKINANLEAQAQALFKSWFVDFEPFQNGEFEDSELGRIPKGWKVESLNSFGSVICGKTPSKSVKKYYGTDVPFIKIPDMHGKVFIIESEDNLSLLGSESQINKLIPSYSLMVSCIATVGLVSINTKPSHTNQQINSIIPSKSSYLFYLYETLRKKSDYIQNLGRGGTATLNVNTKTFSTIKIVKPSDHILSKYNSIIKPYYNIIESNLFENKTLSLLRDTLLPKLMSGEIEV